MFVESLGLSAARLFFWGCRDFAPQVLNAVRLLEGLGHVHQHQVFRRCCKDPWKLRQSWWCFLLDSVSLISRLWCGTAFSHFSHPISCIITFDASQVSTCERGKKFDCTGTTGVAPPGRLNGTCEFPNPPAIGQPDRIDFLDVTWINDLKLQVYVL